VNLSYTEIRAPFSGIVGNLEVQGGQQLSPGQECLRVVNLSEVELSVLETEIGVVKEGRKAR